MEDAVLTHSPLLPGGPMAIVRRSHYLCLVTPLSSWRPVPSQPLMPSVTAGSPAPLALGSHLGGVGGGSILDGLSWGLSCILPAVLRFFLEYQWFVDFAVYSGGVYLFTEAYYYVLGPAKETNIAVFWCLLAIAFSMYPSS